MTDETPLDCEFGDIGEDAPRGSAAAEAVDVALVRPMSRSEAQRDFFAGLLLVGTGPDGCEIRVMDEDGLPSTYYALLPKTGTGIEPGTEPGIGAVALHCDIFDGRSVRAALDHHETGRLEQDPAHAIETPAVPEAIGECVHLGELDNGYGLYALRVSPDVVSYLTHECGAAFTVYDSSLPAPLVRAAVAIAEARITARS